MVISYQTESFPVIAETIGHGGIVAFRTDTFYGLGADPFNRGAVQKIKDLKGREDHKPILIVISDPGQLARFIRNPSKAFKHLAQAFWPGALTLIGQANLKLPEEITAGSKTVGVRVPDDARVRALVRACGGALTATSANPSHAAPAISAQAVLNYFADSIDVIIDDGEAKTDRPSTVVNVSEAEPKLVREGVISWAEITRMLDPEL